MTTKPETRITNNILKFLRKEGGWWFKAHGGPFQQAGIPDILGCFHGHFVAIEVKRPALASNTSSRQKYVMGKIVEAGGYITVATSIDDAAKLIYQIGLDDGRKENGI